MRQTHTHQDRGIIVPFHNVRPIKKTIASPVAAADPVPAVSSLPALAPAVAQGPAFTAPSASFASATAAQINFTATPATGGSGTFSYQWYRSLTPGFVPGPASALAGATSTSLADASSVAPGTTYFYVLGASDGASTVYSNQVMGALSIPTAPINLPYQSGPVFIASIGSSTWAINQGSGQVPAMMDADLRGSFPSANFASFNGAVSGTTTDNFLPGQPLNNAVKQAVMNSNGYRILRLMIGSNDATVRHSAAYWQSNMQAIIQDALTWPVDMIVLEEIGVRLDGGNATLDLIRQYNAARANLLGPKVVLGTAYTFENQADSLQLLSGDRIHQTNPGQIALAANQAAELGALFSAPTTVKISADNAADTLAVDSSGSFIQLSQGNVLQYSYPITTPALAFYLTGNQASLTIDYSNGFPAGTSVTVIGSSASASLAVTGQTSAQVFSMNDYQVVPAGGSAISFSGISTLDISRGIYRYTGTLSTVGNLIVDRQAYMYWG